jgi:polyhydroxyalkanoate synthesis regulator phasin
VTTEDENMDPIKGVLQFGYGMAAIGRDHAKKLAKDLRDHYGLDEEQSKKLARDVVNATIDSQKEMIKIVDKHAREFAREASRSAKRTVTRIKKKVGKK